MPTRELRPQRPNDNQELERFKEEIPLVPLATSRYGYEVTEQARNGSWHKLERGDEMLLVSRKGTHDIYINPNDTKDSGSVVDFVKSRDSLNLGQARQQLRSYLGDGGPEKDQATFAAKPVPEKAVRRDVRGPEADLPDDPIARRDALLRLTLGVQPTLTDRSYLKERGLNDETIGAPAFDRRVFTSQNGPHKNVVFPLINEGGYSSYEEKNTNFKSVMPGVKDGIWVSHPTAGKDKPVERITIGESPIDQMSKYQLEQPGGQGPNTIYIATSGNMSQRQVELIQKVIDKQQPQQVVLASDNDKAGERYNINYLNDLRGPRQSVQLPETAGEAATQPNNSIDWHATRAGKYHTDLKVTFEHEKAFQGRQAVAGLQERVSAWQQEGGEQAAQLNVVRTGSEQTVVRLTVTNDLTPNLRDLAQEMHTQREGRLSLAERTPPGFLVIEQPRLKDYNMDLVEQQQQAQLAAAREKAGFTAPDVAREVEPARMAEPARTAVSEERSLGNHPVERRVTVEVQEFGRTERGGGTAQAIEDDLRRAGLNIAKVEQTDPTREKGERTTQIEALYLSTQPLAERANISRTLDIVGNAAGTTVRELPGDEQARRALTQPSLAYPDGTPEQQLQASRQAFGKATGELAGELKNNGFELMGARLTQVSQQVDRYPDALPLRGTNREQLEAALQTSGRIPSLQENAMPGPLIKAVQETAKEMDQKYQTVFDMGGPGALRAEVRILDDKQQDDNRATQIWKDLKEQGAGVGNMRQRTVGESLTERSFPIQYAPTPSPELTRLNQVLGAVERSPGISIEEAPSSRDLRLQLAGPPQPGQSRPAYEPSPEAATKWVTYAVTSNQPAGSPELQAQLDNLKKAGATVSPVEGQPKESAQQLVSFSVQDGRLGAISDATKDMAQGGNIYDVRRRDDLGEVGGWNVAAIRLTEAQEAARRTPQILDDLRANGILVREPRPLPAPEGFVREEIRVAYDSSRNPAGVDDVLAALKRSPGVEVEESQAQQRSRELLALAQQTAERERQQAIQAQQEAAAQQAAAAQQQREQQQREEAERRANDPAEQRRREQEDRMMTGAILGMAMAEQQHQRGMPDRAQDQTLVQSDKSYPAEGWKTQVLRDRRDDELTQVVPAFTAVGAQVGGSRPDGQGANEIYISYHPAAVQENKVLEVSEKYQPAYAIPGLAIAPQEGPQQREQQPAQPERAEAVQPTPAPVVEQQTSVQPVVAPTGEPGPWRTVEVVVTEQAQAQRAAELREELSKAGATVGPLAPAQPFGPELERRSFTASYQDGVAGQVNTVAPVLEAAGREPGVRLDEPLRQQQERQQQAGIVPMEADRVQAGAPPQGPGQWQQGVIRVEETGIEASNNRTAAIREDLQHSGASVGSGKHEKTPQGLTNEIHYSYNTLQPHLDEVNKVLEKAQASQGVEVKEQNPQRPGPELENRQGQFNQATIVIEEKPGHHEGKDRADTMTSDLRRAGAVVGEAKESNGKVEVPVAYHTHASNIQGINESLDKAAWSPGVAVQENGQDRSARIQGAQEVAAGQNVTRPVASKDPEREVER
jgi:hypothetical protein